MKIMMLINEKDDIKISKDEEMEMFEKIKYILDEPPVTWKKYYGTPDECDSIINMEIQELMDAKKSKSFHDMEREYLHCATAFLHGYLMAKGMHEKHEEE